MTYDCICRAFLHSIYWVIFVAFRCDYSNVNCFSLLIRHIQIEMSKSIRIDELKDLFYFGSIVFHDYDVDYVVLVATYKSHTHCTNR
jgi:hypothetical protein